MTHRSWLISALLIGAILRGVGLFTAPPGPNVDEVSNAIDADCIWQTGKDRHGTFLPLYLRAFDDYREGAYVLIASPLSAVIEPWKGLRILSVVIGMFTIVVTYGAVRRIISPRAAIWGAFFIATDPQHVLWSRLGMEVVLVPLGVALTWWSMSFFATRPIGASYAMVGSLLVTVYSGMMGKPAAAIMFFASLFVSPGWFRAIRRAPGPLFVAAVLFFVCLIPAWWSVFSPEATTRFAQINDTNESPTNPWINRAIRYATYWSPTYLIAPKSEGMPDLPWASKMGYAEWACLMVGIAALAMHPFRGWNPSLLVAALLTAIPAAFTNTIAPSRVFFALPMFVIIMGHGTEILTRWIGSRLASIILATGVTATTLLVGYDLAFHSNEHLETFFWRDAGRAVEKLHTLPADSKLVDAQIPFITEEVIWTTGSPVDLYQGRLADVVRNSVPLAGIRPVLLGAHPIPAGSLLLTWRDRPIPRGRTIHEEGRFKIVELPR